MSEAVSEGTVSPRGLETQIQLASRGWDASCVLFGPRFQIPRSESPDLGHSAAGFGRASLPLVYNANKSRLTRIARELRIRGRFPPPA